MSYYHDDYPFDYERDEWLAARDAADYDEDRPDPSEYMDLDRSGGFARRSDIPIDIEDFGPVAAGVQDDLPF